MKSTTIIKTIFAAVAVAATGARADTETVGGYTWTYQIEDDTAVIRDYSYAGYVPVARAAISPSPTGAVTIPSTLGGKPVTGIGDYAFHNCSGLASVTIPASVTSIGNFAFYGCSGLADVTIPDGVTTIGSSAFACCSGLTGMTISANVISIGGMAFSSCTGLRGFVVAEGNPCYSCINGLLCDKAVTSIIACPAGLTEVTIPDGIANLEYGTFDGCSNLTAVTLPPSVRFVCGAITFFGCDNLTDIMVHEDNQSYASIDGVLYDKAGTRLVACPPGRTELVVRAGTVCIGFNACHGCGLLRSVSLPSSLDEMESDAFASCENLTEIAIPDGVRTIRSGAFQGCPSLSRIFIPASVRCFGSNEEGGFYHTTVNNRSPVIDVDENNQFYSSIDGVLYSKDKTTLFRCPAVNAEVSIPEGVTKIADEAFMNCSRISGVELPDSVTEIGDGAFSATGVILLKIPQGVVSVGGNFQCNHDLETLVIPYGAHFEGALDFYSCSSLRTVYLPESMKGAYGRSDFAGASDDLQIVWYSGAYPAITPKQCAVSFDARGGTVAESSRSVPAGAEVGSLPVPEWPGYAFEGWRCRFSRFGETWTMNVSSSTRIYRDVECFAVWSFDGQEVPTSYPEPEPTPAPEPTGTLYGSFAKAQTVTGALYRDDALVGTVEVKLGRISKTKGTVKVSASATLAVDGKTKKFTARSISPKPAGDGTLSGMLVFKDPIGEMSFAMEAEGSFTLDNALYEAKDEKVGGNWTHTDAAVYVDFADGNPLPAGTIEELLPDGEPVVPKSGKWSFNRNAAVKWARDRVTKEYSLVVDASKGKSNRSSMNLTYTPKTGVFKGSFKVYALEETNGRTKLKKYTVNVIGFVVGGKGQGEASCKKPKGGPWPVTVD